MQTLQVTTRMERTAETQVDEQQLIAAAKQNPQKFGVLYNKYYEQILRFVYQRVTTKDDAFDITQQVFLQAMLALPKYEYRGFPFSSWLYRIAINEMNQVFRKNEKQRGVNLEDRHLRDIVQEIGENSDEDKENAVLAALTVLEEDEFQLVEMRFFEKRAFKEIAEILDITEANAKMRLYRILERIKPSVEKRIKQ